MYSISDACQVTYQGHISVTDNRSTKCLQSVGDSLDVMDRMELEVLRKEHLEPVLSTKRKASSYIFVDFLCI